MDTVPPAHQEARQFSHALPATHTERQMAGQSAKHHHTGEVWHLWHRSRNQFRWCGHVYRMSDTRIPKQLLYGQLPDAKRHAGGQRKRYKDQLRVFFKWCNLDHMKWETLAEDRSAWREECYNAVNGFEEQRVDAAATRVDGPVHHESACSVTNELTKPSLRFVASTTHSIHEVENECTSHIHLYTVFECSTEPPFTAMIQTNCFPNC